MLTKEIKYEIMYRLSNAQTIDTDDRHDTKTYHTVGG